MSQSAHILLVDDEPDILEFMRYNLEKEGFGVETAADGEEGYYLIKEKKPDLIILDLMLPKMNGYELCRKVRNDGVTTPILMLTARGEEMDRVHGLDLGADDYLRKPFELEEIVARVRALLRRPGGALGVELKAGNIVFNTISRNVEIRGEPITLARRELDVLEEMMRCFKRVISKSALEDSLYGFDDDVGSNSIEVHVSRLRKKLKSVDCGVEVHTVRGVGYILSDTQGHG